MISPTGIFKEKVSVVQNIILSPILANIFFHDLDIYIEKEIINRYKKEIKETRFFDFHKVISSTFEEKKANKQKKKQVKHKKRKEIEKAIHRYPKLDSQNIRIKYIRYAHDFLVGVQGPKILAEKIFRSIIFFLKSNLQLNINEEKSKILNSFSNKIPYLGILIYNITNKSISYCKNRTIQNKNRKRFRVISRAKTLEHHQFKLFRNKCLNILRNSYNKYRNNRAAIKEVRELHI